MSRIWGGALGLGVLVVLVVTTVECVRMAREILAVERDRRSRSAGPVERPGVPSSPVDVPGPVVPPKWEADDLMVVKNVPVDLEWVDYLDDDIAQAARRAIADIAGEPS